MPENVYILPWYTGESYLVEFKNDLNPIADVFNSHVADIQAADPWVKQIFGVEGLGEGFVYYPITFCHEMGSMSRKDLKDFICKGKGDIYKDVSITLKGQDGSDIKTINYLQSFLTTYTFPMLNAREDNVEAIETVEIQPGYSDNLLD